MIDIDKYHKAKFTGGPWKYKREDLEGDSNAPYADYRVYIVAPPYGAQGRIAKMLGEHTYADAQLMADAPLLLQALIDERAKVIQLNKIIEFAWEVMDDQTAVEFNDLIIELNGEAEQRWEEE